MRRLVLAGVLAALAFAAPPALLADGDGKDRPPPPKQDGAKEDPKETPVGRACSQIGGDFRGKRSQALVDRVRPKGKLHLALGAAGDKYAADQAKAVLEEWFKDKKDLRLELKSVTGLTGKFDLTWRQDGSDKESARTLCITLERKERAEGFFLAKIEILT